MTEKVEEKKWVNENFELLEKRLNGRSGLPIHDIRKNAFKHFEEIGYPNKRQELWRHTDPSPVFNNRFKILDKVSINENVRELVDEFTIDREFIRAVFVNGRYIASLSDLKDIPNGVRVDNLYHLYNNNSDLVQKYLGRYIRFQDHSFTLLNTAFAEDGFFLYVPDQTILEKPVQVLFISNETADPFVTHPRSLMIFGAGSQAKIIESYAGNKDAKYFSNPVSEFVVKENAHIEHVKLQQESNKAYHVAVQQSHQERDSEFTSFSLSFGGKLTRNDITAVLNGQGVTSTLNGLYMVAGKQHVDHHTFLDHAQPNGNSRQLYKGILGEKSHGVFNGKIFVRQPAQKTDAIQSNKNLLLSDRASVDTQPMLEIFADDVKCTHGGTVGQLDKEGLLYLRSRGIDKKNAQKIMTHSFAGDVFDKLKNNSVRQRTEDIVRHYLEKSLQ